MHTGPALIPEVTRIAGEDLRSYQHMPMVYNAAGKVVRPTLDLAYGLRQAGFLMNKPNINEPALIRRFGPVPVKAEVVTFRTPLKGHPGVVYTTDGSDLRIASGRVSLEDLSHATAPVLDYPAVPGSIVMLDDAGADLTFTAYNAINRTATTTNGDTSDDKVSYDIDAPVWGYFLEDVSADDDVVSFFASVLGVGQAQVADHLV